MTNSCGTGAQSGVQGLRINSLYQILYYIPKKVSDQHH